MIREGHIAREISFRRFFMPPRLCFLIPFGRGPAHYFAGVHVRHLNSKRPRSSPTQRSEKKRLILIEREIYTEERRSQSTLTGDKEEETETRRRRRNARTNEEDELTLLYPREREREGRAFLRYFQRRQGAVCEEPAHSLTISRIDRKKLCFCVCFSFYYHHAWPFMPGSRVVDHTPLPTSAWRPRSSTAAEPCKSAPRSAVCPGARVPGGQQHGETPRTASEAEGALLSRL